MLNIWTNALFLACLAKEPMFSINHSSLVSEEISGLILEVLMKIETLDEAVPETSLLCGQEWFLLEWEEAALSALGDGWGSGLMVELVAHVIGNNLQVELSLHYVS